MPIDYILSAFQQLLLGMPAPVAIIVFALIAWQISSLGMGSPPVSLIAIGAIGAWSQAMVTGAGPHRPAVLHDHRPAAGDLAGAQPTSGENYPPAAGCHADHAGLRLPVPIVMLFGIGNVPGVVVTIIFALPPIVRLTILGINQCLRI